MKLAFIVTEFPKTTETFIQRELLHFMDAGHDVLLIHLTPYRHREVLHEFAAPLVGRARYFPYLFSPTVLSATFRTAWRQPKMLLSAIGHILGACWREPVLAVKSLAILPKSCAAAEALRRWGADHVHAEFAGHPATSAWIIGRLTRIPYSVSCHAHDIFISRALLGPKLREAAFVRAISAFNKAYLEKHVTGIDPTKVVVIHCGLSEIPADASPRAAGSPFRILFVGSLTPKKGVDVLLGSLALLPRDRDWHCDIVGDGPLRARLGRMVEAAGLTARTTFHGAKSFAEVADAMARAHVLVVPSVVDRRGNMEGIPTVAMEALSHATPVIATALSGIPELIRDGETGRLVEPGNADQLARAIVWAQDEPEALARQARQGKQLIAQAFNLRTEADKQLALFRLHRRHEAESQEPTTEAARQ